jgi:hypothetical protein
MSRYVLTSYLLIYVSFATAIGSSTFSLSCDNDIVSPVIVYPSESIILNLEACATGQSATTFFSITASDECDPAPSIVVTVNGTNASTLVNPIGNTYYFIGDQGTYSINIVATDASGNARTENFDIIVQQEPAPTTGVGCNDTLNVTLNNNCQRFIRPDMLFEGTPGCLPDEFFDIQISDIQPQNGQVVDGVGYFNYEITPQQAPTVSGFVGSFAQQEWYLYADSDGEAQFSSSSDSLILEGGIAAATYSFPYAGEVSFDVSRLLSGGNASLQILLQNGSGSIIDQTNFATSGIDILTWQVQRGDNLLVLLNGTEEHSEASLTNWIFDFDDIDFGELTSCWGVIDARDGSAPVLTCPANTAVGRRYVQTNQLGGTITPSSPLLNTSVYSCLLDNFNAPGERHYSLLSFEVTQTDVYSFFLLTDFTSGDGDMALFRSSFDPDNPCSNIIAKANVPSGNSPLGSPNAPYVRIALPLQAGSTYYLFTTTDNIGAFGNYDYWVISDGGGSVINAPILEEQVAFPLYCEDVGLIMDTDSIAWTGTPSVSDNCSSVSLEVQDQLFEIGDCSESKIFRTFEASDEAGNSTSCIQQITFPRPTVEDVSLPPNTAIIECDEAFPLDEFGNPSPSHTGYPFILTFGGVVDLNDNYCNIGASYADGALIEICLLSYQFIRTWTITDWCDPVSTFNFAQVIKIGDFTPPQISAPIVDLDGDGFPDPLVYSTGPFECSAAFSAPLPEVSDNCSTWEIATEVITLDTNVIFNNEGLAVDTIVEEVVLASIPADYPDRFVGDIPLGCHFFRYVVTDECGNTSSLDCSFCVIDAVDPVAICDDQLNASLGDDGYLRLFATNFNENSWDNCAVDTLLVRREISLDEDCEFVAPYFTPWQNFVEFTCCEAGTEIGVELKVIDQAGNENTCSVEILVEDKIAPSCVPPPAIEINCNELPGDFSVDHLDQLQALFGEPEASDNCQAEWVELPPINDLDDCGFGTFTRQFLAIDESFNTSENACQQEITVSERHHYEIRFPKDAEANCGLPNPLDTITYSEMGCDLLAVSVEDNIFSASADECYKIFRTYRVINWCEYDGESGPIVISQDEDCDEQNGEEDVWVLRRPEYTFIDRDNDENNTIPAAGEKGNICDGQTNPEGYWRQETSRGFWVYTQKIKVYDTIPPQILYINPPAFCSEDNESCRAEVEYLFVVSDNCTPNDLDFTVIYDEFADGVQDSVITDIFGTYPKYKIFGDFPIGSHEFELIVTDGCGNTSSATLPFTVADCLPPSPVCINGLAAPLMPVAPDTDADGDGDIDRGALTLFASSFIASELEDCSGPVTYSINRIGEEPDPDRNALIVTCDDLGILLVELYAWDAAMNPYAIQPDGTVGGPNYEKCETFMLVQNNLADCDGGMLVASGVVEREDGADVQNVELQLSGDDDELVYTDTSGYYEFTTLEEDNDYTISPFKDGDTHNGLSTYDIILISNHILGVAPLDSPYKIIAADVNNSGSVSTIDIIQLRQVILSIELEFPNSPSWRFVPKDHIFEDPQNPWLTPLPSSLNYNDLSSSQLDQDFVAIKIGDIDLSASVSTLQEVDDRQLPGAHLIIPDQLLQKGESFKVAVSLEEDNLKGMQGILKFDTELLGNISITPNELDATHWNDEELDNGILPLSWHIYTALDKPVILFTIEGTASSTTYLSEAVSLLKTGLQPEIYLSDHLNKQALGLQFQSSNLQIRLYPNPFIRSTNLLYEAQSSGLSNLRIYNSQGQLVYQSEQWYTVGMNQITLDDHQLEGGAGLYFFFLEWEGTHHKGKMVKTTIY